MLKIEDVLKEGYGSADKLKDIVLNLYNYQTYEAPNMFGFLCNADPEHIELLFALLRKVATERGDSNIYISQLHNLISESYKKESKNGKN